MSLKDDILLELLTARDYVSGEFLAKKYNKSRAAVWKSVKSLEADGYKIDAVTNKGYMLTDSGTLLSAQCISARLENDIDVIYYPEIDSTNNECKRLLADSKQGTFLVVADRQTAGRGRQGKSFYSPAGTGVYFSLVIRPRTQLKNAVTATTAASVAVCKAIERLTDIKPQIKWVNDVYVNGAKVCGILTEAITNFEEGIVDSVVIGIGINISTKDFPDSVEMAGSLNVNINRSALVAEVVNEMMKIAYVDYSTFIDYYRTHSMVIGKRIRFTQNGEACEATAISIDETGGLTVRLDSAEEITLRSGEITVRAI